MFSGTATGVLYAALAMCLAGLALLGYFAVLVKRRVGDTLGNSPDPRRIGLVRGLASSVLGVFLIALSSAGFAFYMTFWNYRALTQEVPIAEITCHSVPGTEGQMLLTIAEVEGGRHGRPLSFEIEGDRWLVGGDVIEWRRYLNLLGLVSSYKIHTVGARWNRATKAWKGRDLNGGSDAFVDAMMRGEGKFPYTLAVREANEVIVGRVPSESGAEEYFLLSITATKFSLKRMDGKPVWERGE